MTLITYNHKGRMAYYDGVHWRYKDDNCIVPEDTRCAKCGALSNKNGHDACIGTLGNVLNACCGHGEEGYIQFDNGVTIRGIFTIERT